MLWFSRRGAPAGRACFGAERRHKAGPAHFRPTAARSINPPMVTLTIRLVAEGGDLSTEHPTVHAGGHVPGGPGSLPRLKTLGIDVIWLMPVHPIGETNRKGTLGSPYPVKDYFGVDPEYGTMGDLKAFVDAAHAQGMHVILDSGGQPHRMGQPPDPVASRMVRA